MMESADMGKCNDISQIQWFNRSRFGRIFVRRQLRPAAIIAAEVLAKDPTQVLLFGHDYVIQTIPANGSDNAFDERI